MNFLVVGAGAWGTAFALHLARAGQAVTLVPRRRDHAEALARRRENADYLPGVALPDTVVVQADLPAALARADTVLLACPAQTLRETCTRIRTALPTPACLRLILSLAKGLESATHRRPSEIIGETLPGFPIGSLTGPTNALEVAHGQPAAMVLASDPATAALAQEVQALASGATLRIYTTTDLAGAEIGGCLKNVYAIAAGCCDGLRLGDSAKAALLTRALAEMVRVGAALGARRETFYGLSGFGDLVATCYGAWSRNRQFGQCIGEGATVAGLLKNRRTVVEGHQSTISFAGLCHERDLDAPILHEVHAILAEGRKPAAALAALMTRGLKPESTPVVG